MAAPFAIVEPVLDSFGIENGRKTQRLMASVISFAGTEDDAHVVELPRVGHVRQIFIRAVEVNVVVMITVEKRANVERSAQADQMTNHVRMTKGNIGRVICSEAGPAHRHSMTITFAPGQI